MKKQKEKQDPKIKQIFKECRIVGLAGNKGSGKTNNLIHLIQDLRDCGNDMLVYAYGLPQELSPLLKKLNVKEISSIKQLINKKDCCIILDEFQKLKINDRRYKSQLAEFIDFIYHRNVYIILSSPNIREFNTIIGGVIEKWLLKSVNINQCVNGSQLKSVIDEYQGKYKFLGSVDISKDELLLINDDEEIIIKCDYEKEADTKKEQKKLF